MYLWDDLKRVRWIDFDQFDLREVKEYFVKVGLRIIVHLRSKRVYKCLLPEINKY